VVRNVTLKEEWHCPETILVQAARSLRALICSQQLVSSFFSASHYGKAIIIFIMPLDCICYARFIHK